METRQLHGPIFILGALFVATSLYVYSGIQIQRTLLDLNFLLLATICACYFIIGASVVIIRKRLRRRYLRYPTEVTFTTLQGIISLPTRLYQLPKNEQSLSKRQLKKLEQNRLKIKNIILGEPEDSQPNRIITQKVSSLAKKLDASIDVELSDLA